MRQRRGTAECRRRSFFLSVEEVGSERVARDLPSLDPHSRLCCEGRGTGRGAGAPAGRTSYAEHTSGRTGVDRQRAGEILDDVDADLRLWLHRYGAGLSESLRRRLKVDGDEVRQNEDERYRQRQGEVSTLIEQATIDRLTREIEELNLRAAQGELFDEEGRLAAIEQSIEEKKEEIDRRRRHYEEIREQLQLERTRILDHLLPKRFAMASEARVFPVAVEIRLPEQGR